MSENTKQTGNPDWRQGKPSPNPRGRPPMSKFERYVKGLAGCLPPGAKLSIEFEGKETKQDADNELRK